jgi:hypothetical protein
MVRLEVTDEHVLGWEWSLVDVAFDHQHGLAVMGSCGTPLVKLAKVMGQL